MKLDLAVSRGRRAVLAALAVAIAGGCTTLAPMEHAQRLYTGRFAATLSRDAERESLSGRFTLAVRPGSVTIDLASPLGNTVARVVAGEDQATLTAPQADGSLATWHGASPEQLAESVLGWPLPVSGLADWIDARPAPGRPAQLSPAAGPAQRIEQDGWTITVDERFTGSGPPRRLTFDRAAVAAIAPAVRLRLIVDEPTSVPSPAPR